MFMYCMLCGLFLIERFISVTIRKEMFYPLIRKYSKLINNLIEELKDYPSEELLRYFNVGTKDCLTNDQIRGPTAKHFFNDALMQQKFKFYAPDSLLHFVLASNCEKAIEMVENYIKFSYHSLLENLHLIHEPEQVLKEYSKNKKILQVKCEIEELSSEQEIFIRCAMCKHLNMPSHSVIFLGVTPGCITLIYKYKISDNSKQQLLQTKIHVKELADLNITWLKIDNEMELKIPSVKESNQVRTFTYH